MRLSNFCIGLQKPQKAASIGKDMTSKVSGHNEVAADGVELYSKLS